jgi:serine/threonine protein kinase
LDKYGNVKISDFGTSKIKKVTIANLGLFKISREVPDTVGQGPIGTRSYHAPELYHGQPIHTSASDVYSYGMVLWEMGIREHPFQDAKNEIDIIAKHEEKIQEIIPMVWPEIYRRAIVRVWNLEPKLRPSAKETYETLEQKPDIWEVCEGGNLDLLMEMVDSILEPDQLDFINQKNENGLTPLHCAVKSRKEYLVSFLLHRGADATQGDSFGRTPLHYAVYLGNISLINTFEYSIRSKYSLCEFEHLIRLSSDEVLRSSSIFGFAKHPSFPSGSIREWGIAQTPVHVAICQQNASVLELLLKYADADAANDKITSNQSQSLSPLHLVTGMKNEQINLARTLLAYRYINVNYVPESLLYVPEIAKGAQCKSPLWNSIKMGHANIARLIVRHNNYDGSMERIDELLATKLFSNCQEIRRFFLELTGNVFAKDPRLIHLDFTKVDPSIQDPIPDAPILSAVLGLLKHGIGPYAPFPKPLQRPRSLHFSHSTAFSGSMLTNYLRECSETIQYLTIENCPKIDHFVLSDVLLELRKQNIELPKLKKIVLKE